MSQDIVADALNDIMNANQAGREEATINWHSKLLMNILDIAKERGYIEKYKVKGEKMEVEIGDLNKCQSIKPRFPVNNDNLDRFIRRYLPSRKFGILIVTTSKGLMTHEEAKEEGIGGSLIAYFY